MRVVGADELVARSAATGVRWGAIDDEGAWRETVRAHLAAAGSALRRTLIDRVLRWHDAPDDEETRERVDSVVDELDAVGDALVGDGGLVGAAPLRAALVGDEGQCLLVGSVPSRVIEAALGAAFVPGRVRSMSLRGRSREELAAALAPLGGVVIDVETWAGLDRSPRSLGAWRCSLEARRIEEPGAVDTTPERGVFVVREGRGRWRRPDATGSSARLERVRQPGGWYRYAWRTAEGERPLSRDEATRTILAVEAAAGGARTATATRARGDVVVVAVPGFVPRAEYRLLLGVGERTGASDGVARYAVSADAWPTVAAVLGDRLGMIVDETGVET
jgi:hypothetical protein